MAERPLRRDYARSELERCFRVAAFPEFLDAEKYHRFRDVFVARTTLRVRRVETPDGQELVTKIGQKLPDPDRLEDPRSRRLTTIYLAPGEAETLAVLPGRTATKRRYLHREDGLTWAIDVWELPVHRRGLILAEVECDSLAALDRVAMPDWAAEEVTDDPAYSAYALAGPPTDRGS